MLSQEQETKLNGILEGLPFIVNEKQLAFLQDFIATKGHACLLGLGGCGKSLMMSILKKYYGDEIVFTGSTGVASQNLPDNIGIGTVYSYLSLPINISTEYDIKRIRNKKCTNLLGTSDLVKIIVVDEAPLLNSDKLDVIYKRIERFNKRSAKRRARRIRLLLVGDPLQCKTIANYPVQKELGERWGSYLMFDSSVWNRFQFRTYVLDKVERQDDKVFKACLDVIRYHNHERLPKCLAWLNQKVNPNYDTNQIILAATNKTVDRINKMVLDANPNPKFHFKPVIKGQFDMKDSLMRPDGVVLCEGLKVMTIVNDTDNRYINGSTGVITSISTEGCFVHFSHSNEEHFVDFHTWENKEVYTEEVVDEEGNLVKKLREKTNGEMTCIKLLPSSCISIAKSQGLTINEPFVIDLEDDWLYTSRGLGDFGTNFVYLALSRGTKLDYITLARPVTMNHIKTCVNSINFWWRSKEESVI